MMSFIFGIVVGLAIGWLFLPRPKFVDDLVAKYWPSFKPKV